GDKAFHIGQVFCVRLVLNGRLCIHDIEETPESGESLLNHLCQLHKDLDRADEDSDIQRIHGKIRRIHLSVCDEISAEYQCDKIHHALEEQIPSHEPAHAVIVGVLGKQECMVAL